MFVGLSLGLRGQLGGSAPLPTDVENFGSVMFPFENGRTTDTAKNGQFTVSNFRTQASGPTSSAPFWQGAYSVVAFCDPHRARVDATNFQPFIMGTNDSTTINRAFGLQYVPNANGTLVSLRRKFRFFVRGEAGPGTWTIESATIPASAKGPFACHAWNDTTNGYLDIYDIATGTKYAGSAVAKPASWVGVSAVAFTNDLFIGSTGNRAFPFDNSAVLQNTSQWRGSIGDILFCDHQLSQAAIESMIAGDDPVTVATGAGATNYCHLPLTSGGAIVLTANTTFTGIALTQQGTLWPGGNLRRQDATNYITLDAYNAGEHFPVAYGGATARIRIKGKVGGLTGTLRWRLVRPNGNAITNWAETGITPVAGEFDGHVTTAEFTGKAQIQVAMSSDMSLIGSSHVDCQSGPVVEIHAQSEGEYALTFGRVTNGANTALAPTLPADADTVVFSAMISAAANEYAILSAQDQPGFIGDGCTAVVNYIRSKTNRSVLVRVNAVSGTSPLALMNDADTTRDWADLVALRDMTRATGASGESVVTGHVIFGWEASLSVINVMPVAYRPLLTGVGASSGVYSASSNIPTADIDHYLFDGSSSANALVVFNPNNRATTGSGATDTDASTEADQRDHFRNYSHIYNYLVGPEMAAHRMEGETAAAGLPSGGVTHPEPNVWEGSMETSLSMGEAILQAIGGGTYPGPVFFETITAGTAANKVKVRLGLPRPDPGDGLAEGATGYSTAAQSGSYTYALHIKKNGGDPGAGFEASIDGGAWSKLNVTSGTITNAATGEVELTLASTPTTSVAIRYLPGSTGRYSSATITQDNWRAGVLYFSGEEYAAGEPNSVDDLLALGWQVAGSNQALTLTL